MAGEGGVPSPVATTLYMSLLTPAPQPGVRDNGLPLSLFFPEPPRTKVVSKERFEASSLGTPTCW